MLFIKVQSDGYQYAFGRFVFGIIQTNYKPVLGFLSKKKGMPYHQWDREEYKIGP